VFDEVSGIGDGVSNQERANGDKSAQTKTQQLSVGEQRACCNNLCNEYVHSNNDTENISDWKIAKKLWEPKKGILKYQNETKCVNSTQLGRSGFGNAYFLQRGITTDV
jgi:hypothetical protein